MSRIVTNSSALTVYKSYNRSNVALAASAERLSTGLRINRAMDDPAGLAISETLRAQIKGSNMAAENISNANSFINTSDGFLQNVHDIMGRLEELAIEYGDPTKSVSDKSNLASEFSQLKNQAVSILQAAKYNGLTIFRGELSGLVIDANGVTMTLSGFDATTAMANMNAATIDSIASIMSAINSISTMRGDIGAAQSKLNFTLIGLENYAENVSAAEGRIRNVDVAKEATNFAKHSVLTQAGLAMLAQANALPQSVLQLLG